MAGDEEGGDSLFATPDEGFGMEADNDGMKVRIKKLHKRIFDAIQLKCAAAQLKRAMEILAVDPKDYRALSYVAARACKQVNSVMSSAPTQRAKYGVGQFRDVVQYRFWVPMNLLRLAYSLRINTRENKATGHEGVLFTCDLEGHEESSKRSRWGPGVTSHGRESSTPRCRAPRHSRTNSRNAS